MPLKNSGIHIGNTTASLSNFLASTKSAISSLKEEIFYQQGLKLYIQLVVVILESSRSTRSQGAAAVPDLPAGTSELARREEARHASRRACSTSSTFSSWQETVHLLKRNTGLQAHS